MEIGGGVYFPYDVGYSGDPVLAIYAAVANRSRLVHGDQLQREKPMGPKHLDLLRTVPLTSSQADWSQDG